MSTPRNSDPVESADDIVSDPARDDEAGSDWATEGGSTPAGPATDVDADRTSEGSSGDGSESP